MEDIVTFKIVSDIVRKSGLGCEVLSYEVKPGDEKAQFMSLIFLIKAQLKREDGFVYEKTIFFKTIPRNSVRREQMITGKQFVREMSMYSLMSLLKDKCDFSAYPTVYDTFSDGFSDYLALENLHDIGYYFEINRIHSYAYNLDSALTF
jgi:hypothetical protein